MTGLQITAAGDQARKRKKKGRRAKTMKTSEEVFLQVAEEMSFSKTASKNYISQQAVSSHIRKLEEELDTKLFVRSPKLQLTETGQLLYASLLKIRRIEEQVREAIADSSDLVHGHIRVGMHRDRAHMAFHTVYQRFHARYPNVTVSLIGGHTYEYLEMLRRGQLDLMVGHDVMPDAELSRETIFEEPIYLVGTEKYFRRHLPGWTLTRPHITPEELLLLPLACTSFGCSVMDHMKRFFAQQNVNPSFQCEVGDYMTLLSLSRLHECAFFCPESYMAQREFVEAMHMTGEDRVIGVPVLHMDSMIRVEMISRSEEFTSRYIRDFRRILLEEYQNSVLPVRGICAVNAPSS